VVSSGASSDLAKATRLAHLAVTRWGFDEAFGPVSLDGLPAPATGPVESLAGPSVKTWLTRASTRADELVNGLRQPIAVLAETLLREESLDGEEVKAAWEAARAEEAGAASETTWPAHVPR
jgi:ATP-dependent Zn protease